MKAIVAVDKNWGIGKDNDLLFRLPADMAFFKQTTLNSVVVMGRKTLQSFPGGKPLKDRVNIVLSNTLENTEGVEIAKNICSLKRKLKKYNQPVFVIGGATVYKALLDACDEILVTKVDADGNADTFFPNLDENKKFELVFTSEVQNTNGYDITFNTYKKK